MVTAHSEQIEVDVREPSKSSLAGKFDQCHYSKFEWIPSPYRLFGFATSNLGRTGRGVVDNGSVDGSLEWLRTQGRRVLSEMGQNIGAPAAKNPGVRDCKGAKLYDLLR